MATISDINKSHNTTPGRGKNERTHYNTMRKTGLKKENG
jgi:hypothetical protein